MHIVHALTEADWEQFQQDGEYRPPSLDEEGFVHCSKPSQMAYVADVVHADETEMVLLVLDESRLAAPVRYETNEDDPSPFPHVYGPLTLDAVVDSFPFTQDETGFRLPDGLLRY